jgi:hypothetical protein
LVARKHLAGITPLDLVLGRLIVADIAPHPALVIAGRAWRFSRRFDFDFIPGRNELSGQSKGFSLKDQIDQIDCLSRLIFRLAMRDLIGVKLEGQPVKGDGVHWSIFLS